MRRLLSFFIPHKHVFILLQTCFYSSQACFYSFQVYFLFFDKLTFLYLDEHTFIVLQAFIESKKMTKTC